jgi:hypothetical protein
MTKTIIIKKEKGQPLTLKAEQVENNIVLTKSGDRTSENIKRKIIIEPMNTETYKKFVKIEVRHSVSKQIIDFINRTI